MSGGASRQRAVKVLRIKAHSVFEQREQGEPAGDGALGVSGARTRRARDSRLRFE